MLSFVSIMPETVDKSASDLDSFVSSPPQQRLDDKAAFLETEISEQKAKFNKERFVYLYCVVVLLNILIGQNFNGAIFSFTIVSSIILLIGVGKWLDFPFIHDRLDRWERLLFDALEKKLTGKKSIDTEPIDGS
jgi:hypothetical protein